MQNETTEGAPITGGPVYRSVRPVAEVTGTAAGTTFVMSLTDCVLIDGMKLYHEGEIRRFQRRISEVEAELQRVQDTSLRECGIGFVDVRILRPEHELNAAPQSPNESNLRRAAQRMVDAFAPHADKCRPCTIEWQNLKAALQNEA